MICGRLSLFITISMIIVSSFHYPGRVVTVHVLAMYMLINIKITCKHYIPRKEISIDLYTHVVY